MRGLLSLAVAIELLLGGDNPRDAADSLVNKFNTHIFHGNACSVTNEWASKILGKIATRRANYSRGTGKSVNVGINSGSNEGGGRSSNSGWSSSHSSGAGSQSSSGSNSGSNNNWGSNWGANRGRGTSHNESRGYSESMEFAIEPGDFARILKDGGNANHGIVTGICFQASRVSTPAAPTSC